MSRKSYTVEDQINGAVFSVPENCRGDLEAVLHDLTVVVRGEQLPNWILQQEYVRSIVANLSLGKEAVTPILNRIKRIYYSEYIRRASSTTGDDLVRVLLSKYTDDELDEIICLIDSQNNL